MKNRESGLREKITCIIPADRLIVRHDEILSNLEADLNATFGGYTVHRVVGGWRDGHGADLEEVGYCYNVSYPASDDPHDQYHVRRRSDAINLFRDAGEQLNQEWLHIERSTFEAEHRRCIASASSYSNPAAAYRAGTDGQGFSARRWHAAKDKTLDDETRQAINNPSRSTENARR